MRREKEAWDYGLCLNENISISLKKSFKIEFHHYHVLNYSSHNLKYNWNSQLNLFSISRICQKEESMQNLNVNNIIIIHFIFP